MTQNLRERLSELQQEFANGEKMLVDLKTRQRDLEETLLRISGAIQVLEELLAAEEDTAGDA